jgi:hypothetical protein
LRKILRINVLVPEYPGYSIYKDIKGSIKEKQKTISPSSK